jgi:hypothetical protein
VDQLDLEGLRLGTGILAGGVVGLITALVSFHYAQRLQRERDERRTAELRRALALEIRENIRRLGGGEAALAMPLVPLIRSAWDQARGQLLLSKEAINAIAAGHQAATYAHEVTLFAMMTSNRPWSWLEKRKVPALAQKNIKLAQSQSLVARQSFVAALAALGEAPE